MLELLTGTGKAVYPNSGPGSIVLEAGDGELGYFGEVSSSELFTTSELSSLIDFNYGTIVTEYPVWFKFAYKHKFLFIPKTPLKHSVAWTELYRLGIVNGTDDAGPFAGQLSETDTNQLRIVTKGGFRLKLRLIEADAVNPSDRFNSPSYDSATDDNEWNALIARLSNNFNASLGALKFANYSPSELGTELYTLTQTLNSTYARVVVAGNSLNTYYKTNTALTATSNMGWRPVLEVMDNGEIYADYKFTTFTDRGLIPLTAIRRPIKSEEMLIGLGGFGYLTDEQAFVYRNYDGTNSTDQSLVTISKHRVSKGETVFLGLSDLSYASDEIAYVYRNYEGHYVTSVSLIATSQLRIEKRDTVQLAPISHPTFTVTA